ncbi:hypothetical protein FJ444_17845 [Aestuariibacter sp. GS-14]|uniref:tetratricopeptide repeat protein n=1 Tax=Aestuariibacter sp. GS-14 TaxID=2590670 RepID=UPI00112BF21B|nr:hypothetical protein [Aestuariibacter sp. GS-14]TPV55121.1 hypothetical protein FJ444_17845 [Aestuariibacter sp. GS-14]
MFERDLTYPNGIRFRQIETQHYFIDYVPGDLNKLVITFENADKPDIPRPDGLRYAWGSLYLNKKGYCVLGIKPKVVDWYRGKCLHQFFRSSDFKAFASSFNKVFFYGSSMGGFAAMVFSDAVPNSTVIAFNPQTTLIPELTEWDKRYPQGTSQDWNGDFNDARRYARNAKRIYVAYDPFCVEDNKHISRIVNDVNNLIPLKMPFVGHVIMMWLQRADILEDFLEGAFSEQLTPHDCNVIARKRKNIARYYHVFGLHTQNQAVVFSCVLKLLELNEIPESFPGLLNELMQKIQNKAILEFDKISLKSRDDMCKPHVARGYFIIAKRASDLGLIQESLDFSLKIIRYAGHSTFILINISECLLRQKKYQQALVYVDEALICDSNIANAYRLKSRIQLELGDYDGAVNSASKSLCLEDTNKLGLIDLLNASIKAERLDLIGSSARRLVVEFGDSTYQKYLT